jgi:chromatin assembly factor 1 subunit A
MAEMATPPKKRDHDQFLFEGGEKLDARGRTQDTATEGKPTTEDTPRRAASPARGNTGSVTDAVAAAHVKTAKLMVLIDGSRKANGDMNQGVLEGGLHETPGDKPAAPSTEEKATPSKRAASPARSNTGSATDAMAAAQVKRAKLTFAEKELKRINKEIKEREKADERARKEAEREEKRMAIEAEKAAKEEKRRRREEERRVKEEEKLRVEEEKRKKERAQKTLNSFFKVPAASPAAAKNSLEQRASMSPAPSNSVPSNPVGAVDSPSTPSKPEVSYYDKQFPPFFIKEGVEMAPINRFERDEEASVNRQRVIDSYIVEKRDPDHPDHQLSFDALSLFHLPRCHARGKRVISVREIMAQFSGNATRPIDLTDSSKPKSPTDLLRAVPMKFLQFQEDVRPPYRGTYTSLPLHGMAKLARNPLRRDLPDTNYDYDSEAEWIEDEDAEDLNSEGEEDDAELDDAEDMDGFLDDENDELANPKRLVLQGDLEPISTGLCWEDERRKNGNTTMGQYRMEIILGMSILRIMDISKERS